MATPPAVHAAVEAYELGQSSGQVVAEVLWGCVATARTFRALSIERVFRKLGTVVFLRAYLLEPGLECHYAN